MTTTLRQKRIENGWTLEYVAIKVGVTKAAYQKIETLKRKPSYDVLVKIEKLFGKSHKELFSPANDLDQTG